MSTATQLMTAEEFARLPNAGVVRELVRGEVVELNQPYPRHGQICVRIARLIGNHAESNALGHVIRNDSGIVTERDPDTVRGGDVWFVSYKKVPPGPLPQSYVNVVPDLVFELNSPTDRWGRILRKVGEYLEVGIPAVCVVDPDEEVVVVYHADRPEVILSGDDLVAFPEQLPGFEVAARCFFE